MKIAIVLVLAACGSKRAPAVIDRPSVHVDHRIETLAIIDRLARSPEATQATGPYAREVDVAMAPFADHAAVAMASAMRAKGFGFEQPMDLAIRLDAPPPELATYAAAIAQFATDAKVEDFLAAHQRYIADVEHAFTAQIDANNPVAFFRDVFGETGTHFTVVPALLQGPQNYGVHRDREAYQLIGLGTVDDHGLPTAIDGDLIVHEMAHSFVNPAIDRHAAELDAAATSLFALVAPAMDAQHYTTPRIMLYESVVRAVTSLYVRRHRGDRAAADAIRGEVRRGFVWTAELEATIGKQHAHDLEALMPVIAKFFIATAATYEHGLPPLAFLGPVDAVYQHPIAIVTSPAIHDYAVAINDKLFAGKWPVTSTGSFEQFPHVGVVAYGSAATNPIVDAIVKRAGWSVAGDGITLGTKHWSGEHLLLIATWPRTDDPTRGVVVYTAADDADVNDANALRAGPTDWVVGQKTATGFTVLARGDFPHAADGAWLLP
ncbi:MAG: DUF4932 domain-containing protein [Kofleriaceae bacterium]